MTIVQPSCPALLIHDDEPFRKALIAELDQSNFSVTFAPDGDEAIELLKRNVSTFRVMFVGLDLKSGKGTRALEYLRDHRADGCGLIIIGEANPELRTFAPWADETLLKPVDPAYVVRRAQTYCNNR